MPDDEWLASESKPEEPGTCALSDKINPKPPTLTKKEPWDFNQRQQVNSPEVSDLSQRIAEADCFPPLPVSTPNPREIHRLGGTGKKTP